MRATNNINNLAFLFLSGMLLYEYTTVYLTVYVLMDICIIPSFVSLQIKLL